jgi:iron complex outermembrane receptor protein
MKNFYKLLPALLLAFNLRTAPGIAAEPEAPRAELDITELSVEDLTKVKVTSVSKHSEPLSGAAAAIYVVSGEDLRRQGFLSLANSLRYVPGMQVAQINSHTWGVSARGFNGEYATKLLVLMDGRSVYTPLNAGVYWDVQDTILEDLDRVEVIRGPGAALWGANAVNGVVNITSKLAQETQGWLVTGGGGSEANGFAAARYGGKFGAEGYYRIYGSYKNRDDSKYPDGRDADDDWQMGRTGFRIDWGSADADVLTVQGDIYAGRESWAYTEASPVAPFTQTTIDDHNLWGANVLGRWTRKLADDSEFKIQSYFDHTERESNLPSERRELFDVDAQHHFALNNRNDIVWGLGYRFTADAIQNSYANSFNPNHEQSSLANIFAQDEITIVENRLRLTLGTKLEHNEFTGFEWQPSGRLAWTPTEKSTVWTAVSRAVRTPSRAEEDVQVIRPGVTILGSHSGQSETLLAYELGYRALLSPRFSYDIVGFYHDYDELRSLEPIGLTTLEVQNKLKGESWGIELASDWQMLDWWRWRAAYAFIEINLHPKDGSIDIANTAQLLEGNAPRNQISLRSQLDLSRHVEFDAGIRYVDNLSNPHIPSYTEMDVRLAWRPRPELEFSLVGLNLLKDRHAEFAATQVITPQREIERSIYGKITWRF